MPIGIAVPGIDHQSHYIPHALLPRLARKSCREAPAAENLATLIAGAGASGHFPHRLRRVVRLAPETLADILKSSGGDGAGDRAESQRADDVPDNDVSRPRKVRPPLPTYLHGGFREWLLLVERSLVDPAVLDSYERAFQHGLEALIQRTRDPELRRTFEGMRQLSGAGQGRTMQPLRRLHPGRSSATAATTSTTSRIAFSGSCFRMLSPGRRDRASSGGPSSTSTRPPLTIFASATRWKADLQGVPVQRLTEHHRRQDSRAADEAEDRRALHRLRQMPAKSPPTRSPTGCRAASRRC